MVAVLTLGREVGEQLRDPAGDVERSELGAAAVGLPQPSDHDPEQRDRSRGMTFDELTELGGRQHLRGDRVERERGRQPR